MTPESSHYTYTKKEEIILDLLSAYLGQAKKCLDRSLIRIEREIRWVLSGE